MDVDQEYLNIKVTAVGGRYLHRDHLLPVLQKLQDSCKVEMLGYSVNRLPIEKIRMGNGPVKILMWSQMHGNESTTTKAVLDLLMALCSENGNARELLNALSLEIIPMLNPDGALGYTRVNANGIDLNRDAQDMTQPESKILRSVYEKFSPDFCFNLHDQRTIYSAGEDKKPATLSFLSPAADAKRTITESRLKGMSLIAGINQEMQRLIPGQVGRYDDSFNANCVGDAFQMLGTPTILFEAGHFQGDYEREATRRYVFLALWKALELIAFDSLNAKGEMAYSSIPENKKYFFDILINNAHLLPGKHRDGDSLGILYEEQLKGGGIIFQPKVERRGGLQGYFGHVTYDCTKPDELILLQTDPVLASLLNLS
jgi:hypothetical protein